MAAKESAVYLVATYTLSHFTSHSVLDDYAPPPAKEGMSRLVNLPKVQSYLTILWTH